MLVAVFGVVMGVRAEELVRPTRELQQRVVELRRQAQEERTSTRRQELLESERALLLSAISQLQEHITLLQIRAADIPDAAIQDRLRTVAHAQTERLEAWRTRVHQATTTAELRTLALDIRTFRQTLQSEETTVLLVWKKMAIKKHLDALDLAVIAPAKTRVRDIGTALQVMHERGYDVAEARAILDQVDAVVVKADQDLVALTTETLTATTIDKAMIEHLQQGMLVVRNNVVTAYQLFERVVTLAEQAKHIE